MDMGVAGSVPGNLFYARAVREQRATVIFETVQKAASDRHAQWNTAVAPPATSRRTGTDT